MEVDHFSLKCYPNADLKEPNLVCTIIFLFKFLTSFDNIKSSQRALIMKLLFVGS